MIRAGICVYWPSEASVYAPAVIRPAMTTSESSVDRRARARGDAVAMARR